MPEEVVGHASRPVGDVEVGVEAEEEDDGAPWEGRSHVVAHRSERIDGLPRIVDVGAAVDEDRARVEVDRDAVARERLREDVVRDFGERQAPAGKGRQQDERRAQRLPSSSRTESITQTGSRRG